MHTLLILSAHVFVRSKIEFQQPANMPRSQQGILSESTNPFLDADVIMTAAVVGHAYARLSAGKNCCFDVELELREVDRREQNNRQALNELQSVINKINTALIGSIDLGRQLARVGVTPNYNREGEVVRISGGTGDLPLHDLHRYYPDMPKGWALALYKIANEVGYQGRGAYSGFVDRRKGGQTALKSTVRIKVPDGELAKRWLPNERSYKTAGNNDKKENRLGASLGAGSNERIWGMIINNAMQESSIADFNRYANPEPAEKEAGINNTPSALTLRGKGMHFADGFQHWPKNNGALDAGKDVVGYTHGMIQAIYDVKLWENENGKGKGGTPYEIAVGNETTKLASCFPCAVFMEANGFPASSTHLGRGESWCPMYPVHTPVSNKQDKARKDCNDKWAVYCSTIMNSGVSLMDGLVTEDHRASFNALRNSVIRSYGYTCANLILDALTVHDKEQSRIKRVLIP
jgi:hypothetical protein